MNNFVARFPKHSPKGMSVSAYDHHVQLGQCARLLRGECSQPCEPVDEHGEYPVDFDHIQAHSCGGDDADWNYEPKCASVNRWQKGARLDSRFSQFSHFDQVVNILSLRPHQYSHGYGLVKGEYKGLFESPSDELLSHYILLAWMVGTGKSIGMKAILHGINEVIQEKGPARRRIFKVLWLVHQESLVRSICAEVENEPTDYGIIPHKPNTAIVKCAEDWQRVTPQADIVFACTQSLWNTKNARLTMEDRRQKLSAFDAIVIDECHYGVDRYVEILALAPHALKFVMSATPLDGNGTLLSKIEDGKFRHLFRVFSVFGYSKARKAGFLKNVFDWDAGVKALRYCAVAGGESDYIERGKVVNGDNNTTLKYNSPRKHHVIKMAIDKAKQIKEYPAHVIVRCDSVIRLKSLEKSLKDERLEYFPDEPGWDVTSIYSGSKGVSIDNPDHPWMVVKKKGAVSAKSARLLLAVNMGQFGVNNPYCSVVAWTDPNLSQVELVQRIGRAVRVLRTVPLEKQEITLVFPDIPKAVQGIQSAIDYILNMENVINGSFAKLLDKVTTEGGLMNGAMQDLALTSEIRYHINEMHGLALPDGLSQEDIKCLAENLSDDASPEFAQKIKDYVERLDSEEYKDAQFGLPDSAQPIVFVHQEKCKKTFTQAEMKEFVVSNYKADDIPVILGEIESLNEAVIRMVSSQLRDKHSRFNRPPSKFFTVQELLGTNDSNRDAESYFGQLKMKFKILTDEVSYDERKKISRLMGRSLYRACATAFGLPDFQQKTYVDFEAQLSCTMCAPSVRSRIINRAKAIVINELKEQMPGHYSLYVNQIQQFLEAENHAEV